MPPYSSRITGVREKFLDRAPSKGPFDERTGQAKPNLVLDSLLVEIHPALGQGRGHETDGARMPGAALPAIARGPNPELRARQGNENADSYVPAPDVIRRISARPAFKRRSQRDTLKVCNYLQMSWRQRPLLKNMGLQFCRYLPQRSIGNFVALIGGFDGLCCYVEISLV
jgi:hypothetical protein